MSEHHYYALVVPNEDADIGGFVARWYADDRDGNAGYGDTPLEALACLCAIQEQSETGEKRDWQLPHTTPRAQQSLATDAPAERR